MNAPLATSLCSALLSRDGAPIPLEHVAVHGDVFGGDAKVRVSQRFRSAEAGPIEAIYTFPLPADATLVGFSMTCAGRTIDGVVKEREQAFKAYDDAITAGHGGALLEQERSNVFTAQVGNLLPGEETVIEVSYLQRVRADEGALRFSIPTLVAPRYVPGAPKGDRTAHGVSEPTDQVPDADRISPPRVARAPYSLSIDVAFRLGVDVELQSPSHAIAIRREGGRDGRDGVVVHASFAQANVPLDRDVVITARGVQDAPLQTVVTHAEPGKHGVFALTVVPDLFDGAPSKTHEQVVFAIDVSGSMGGSSLTEAQAALRLCLRHLREGDRFNVVAFNDRCALFADAPVVYTQSTLERADAWVAQLVAQGGTEMMEPLVKAIAMAPDGVVVLLTDGQVGNEDAILARCLSTRKTTRVFSFGIGTNVSDALLRDLARRTAGAVEFIHPGERIDEKVISVFARAIAARVTDVSVTFEGVDAFELAPADLATRALVDGEPWTLFGRYDRPAIGCAHVRGTLRGERWHARIPLDFPSESSHPTLLSLWARERIRDLEDAVVEGRRAEAMRARIVELAVTHGIATRYTSFVVVETRTGDRRTSQQPTTRVVPVALPAGWSMFDPKPQHDVSHVTRAGGYGGARVMRARAMAPMAKGAFTGAPPPPAPAGSPQAYAPMPMPIAAPAARSMPERAAPPPSPIDPIVALLGAQLASGLFAGTEPHAVASVSAEVASLRETTRALLTLFSHGITTAHAVHGEQVRKAVVALIDLVQALDSREAKWIELALGVAALVSSGRRTRRQVEVVAASIAAGLAAHLGAHGDDARLQAHVEALASSLR